jgi:hypothetical protein
MHTEKPRVGSSLHTAVAGWCGGELVEKEEEEEEGEEA